MDPSQRTPKTRFKTRAPHFKVAAPPVGNCSTLLQVQPVKCCLLETSHAEPSSSLAQKQLVEHRPLFVGPRTRTYWL